MKWDKSELNELTKQICQELKDVGFGITDWELMEDFVREGLRNSSNMDFLSEIIINAYNKYKQYETDDALLGLLDKGLISMYVNENGKLAYKPTEKGRDLGTLIHKFKKMENLSNKLNEYPRDCNYYQDQGENYGYVVIPAGKVDIAKDTS